MKTSDDSVKRWSKPTPINNPPENADVRLSNFEFLRNLVDRNGIFPGIYTLKKRAAMQNILIMP
jgi:hypothetical protein